MPRERNRERGFTLIELMVVIAVLGLITAQILGIFSAQLQTYQGQKAVLETQDDARLAMDLVFTDVRMAGYMVPQAAAIAAVDGGNAAADVLCVSDASIMDETQVDNATARFSGASIVTAPGGDDDTIELNAAELDIDGDGDDDFAQGSGIIIVDGTETHCARITDPIAGGVITFAPRTPLAYAATTAGIAVPAVVYEWNNGLLRNNLLVSSHVEDLQAEFGVDGDSDGQLSGLEFPLDGLYGRNTSQVLLVRLSLLARTAVQDQTLPGLGRQQVANRDAAGAADNFRRRLLTVSATPRNMM